MGYFNIDELFILGSIKIDTKIKDITYYRWHNLTVSKNPYIFIDKIEIQFNNIPSILLEINDTDDGITLKTHYNVANEIKEIEKQFNSEIRITRSIESNNEIWLSLNNLPLLSIEAEEHEKFYLNGTLLLNFGHEKRIIHFEREVGLLVEIYEED